MRAIIEAEYDQRMLLPDSVEDWIGSEHPARYIREIVRSIDLQELGFECPDEVMGGKVYSSGLLLGLWLYGYWKRIRSSRKLESACREEMGFIWLSGRAQPDHNTLWRFWAKNQAGIKNLFKRSVSMAMELGEVDLALTAIDGTKLQAACGSSGLHSKEHNQKLLNRLEIQIAELEKAIEQNADQQQEPQPGVLSEALRDKKRLAQRVKEALRHGQQNTQGYVHPQEPDAQRMPINGRGNRFGYNAQLAVDAKSQIIVASEVVDCVNDRQQLMPMLQAIEATTGQAPTQTLADGGYSSAAQLQKAAEKGLDVYTPLIDQSRAPNQAYHTSRFRYDAHSDTVQCPEGQVLKFYHRRNKGGVLIKIYRNTEACRRCAVRTLCTQQRFGRTIDIYPWHQLMEAYRQKIMTVESQALLKRRSVIVEPVLAWLKEQAQFRRFSFRGLSKVGVQWALVCAVHNFKILAKRAIKRLAPNPSPQKQLVHKCPNFLLRPIDSFCSSTLFGSLPASLLAQQVCF